MGQGDRTFTLMVGDTRAAISLCIRKRKPEQELVPPDSTMWPKRTFQRAELQELTLWKAFMWMPRPFLPVRAGGGRQRLRGQALGRLHARALCSQPGALGRRPLSSESGGRTPAPRPRGPYGFQQDDVCNCPAHPWDATANG